MNNELNILMKATEDLYRPVCLPDISTNNADIDQFIKIASKNNLLLYSAGKILTDPDVSEKVRGRFQKIIDNAQKDILKIKKSLKEIRKFSPNALVFKTFRGTHFTRIPNDIDILTNHFNGDIKKFSSSGYQITDYDPRESSAHIIGGDIKKIHIHSRITWAWEDFFDQKIIFENPRTEIFNGQKIIIPNITADVLIHVAHMNFEPLNMVYSELLYLFTIIPKMNFRLALEQTEKYHWRNTFLRTLNLINSIHCSLYGEKLIKERYAKGLDLKDIDFPYCFPRTHLILSVFEKRIFFYSLTRLIKIFRILLRGDTFTGYISPAEGKFGDLKSTA